MLTSGLGHKIDRLPTRWQLFWICAVCVAAGVIAIIGFQMFAQDRYEGGLSAGSELNQRAAEQQQAIERIEEQQQEILDRLPTE